MSARRSAPEEPEPASRRTARTHAPPAPDPASTAAVGSLARLRNDCRLAKEQLSAETATAVHAELPGFASDVRVTRTELEQLIAAQATPSAYLLQQLGDLYFEVELYTQAEESYQAALEAAQTGNDPTAQAAAHFGLAQVLSGDDENKQVALDHLTRAEMLYRQAGETALADQIAAERAKIKE